MLGQNYFLILRFYGSVHGSCFVSCKKHLVPSILMLAYIYLSWIFSNSIVGTFIHLCKCKEIVKEYKDHCNTCSWYFGGTLVFCPFFNFSETFSLVNPYKRKKYCSEIPYFTIFFQITVDAMKSEEDEIALQGIEFWSSLCDEEVELALEAAEVRVKHFYYLS